MAQSDQSVQNATFPSVRADINDNLAALFSQSSGNSTPSVTVAFQPWVDTSSSPPVWKVRNGSNSAWITVGVLDPAGFNAGGITAIANGGTGAITAALALAALLPSQTGNAGKALVTDATTATWTTINGITRDTAVASTSGTSIDFISIPSGVKRVMVMFNGVSTNGTSNVQLQIGAGSFISTGYTSSATRANNGGVGSSTSTTGLLVESTPASGADASRYIQVTLLNISGNTWVFASLGNIGGESQMGNGTLALSGTLDRIRITTVNGTDTFDAGSINILYES